MTVDLEALPAGVQLRVRRVAAGWTQEQAAAAAAIKQEEVSRLERGERVLRSDPDAGAKYDRALPRLRAAAG